MPNTCHITLVCDSESARDGVPARLALAPCRAHPRNRREDEAAQERALGEQGDSFGGVGFGQAPQAGRPLPLAADCEEDRERKERRGGTSLSYPLIDGFREPVVLV